ncbi:MAG: hypothetical protein AABX02_01405 [archaeon]
MARNGRLNAAARKRKQHDAKLVVATQQAAERSRQGKTALNAPALRFLRDSDRSRVIARAWKETKFKPSIQLLNLTLAHYGMAEARGNTEKTHVLKVYIGAMEIALGIRSSNGHASSSKK